MHRESTIDCASDRTRRPPPCNVVLFKQVATNSLRNRYTVVALLDNPRRVPGRAFVFIEQFTPLTSGLSCPVHVHVIEWALNRLSYRRCGCQYE